MTAPSARTGIVLLLGVQLALTLASPRPVRGHAFAPALLELEELGTQGGEHVVSVRWKQPAARPRGTALLPILPPSCTAQPSQSTIEGTGLVSRWQLACRKPLLGQTIEVEGIGGTGAGVLLRIKLEDGRKLAQVLTAEDPGFTVPERQTRLGVTLDYTRIGFDHILSGTDHLLFVLALLLIVGPVRKLLWTVTAFTLGHSVTLALAVLGFVKFPPAPIEAAIALSIYFLAIELLEHNRGQRSLVDRMPWVVTGGFGLLHGLGFAGALEQVGLPEGEIPLALFAFNVGIELGQLAFIGAVLLVWILIRVVPVGWPTWARSAPAYCIGPLAAYWFFERVAGVLQSAGALSLAP